VEEIVMFFKNNNQTKIKKYDKVSSESILGRGYTSLKSAKDELHREHISYNPLDYISIKRQFFGLNLYTKEPYFLPFQDSTHLLYVGATRSAKGVALAHRVVEAIRQNIGIIIIDPKRDDFLLQIIKEELQKQNRSDDLIIASYPNNFGYSGFNSDDTYLELANKLTVALDLAPTDDPKADYYRRNERTLLKQICKIFLNSQKYLNIKFELNYKSLLNFIKYLMSDLKNIQLYQNEQAKNKPNFDLLEQYSKRYFNIDLFLNLELNFDDIGTLKGLYQTIEELTDANIFTSINIDDALYNNKIIYIQADQLDVASLKMLKILQVDIIQKAKKKTANCIVIADEVSFYATKTLADSLSTIAGFGVRYILAMQDLAQLSDDFIKKPILSNCQTKLFYKSSDIETLEYIEKISGKELVTQMSKQNNDITIRQTQEEYLNITRLRAIKRDRVAILIAESLPSPVITQTWHIEVTQKFNWNPYLMTTFKPTITTLKKEFKIKCDDKD
jgi:type IV secretion system protein VirD4